MDDSVTPKQETIRMLFELDRDDDPRLYDDLIRFKKGTEPSDWDATFAKMLASAKKFDAGAVRGGLDHVHELGDRRRLPGKVGTGKIHDGDARGVVSDESEPTRHYQVTSAPLRREPELKVGEVRGIGDVENRQG